MTGSDANGNAFSQTVNSSGYVTISGAPGTWGLTLSDAGYATVTSAPAITSTQTVQDYLVQNQQVTLTLYVHAGSASGQLLPAHW